MSKRRKPTIYPSSVGELIDRTNLLARDLLYEAPHRDGRAMLRGWGEAVEGASEVWHRLPQRSDAAATGMHVIDQLERSARTLHRSAGGASEVDPTLQEIGQSFAHAAELISGSGVLERREPSRWTDAQLRDAFAARVNIMHTLYVTSHAVSVGLAQNALAERFDARLRVHHVSADELRHRVLDVEQVAHSYISGHYPHALEGRQREPVDDTRIPAAIAQWDVQAQRALVREPTTQAMTRVAGSAFAATVHAARLWRAAVETGHVDRRAFDHELAPALETMIETWDHTHTLLRQLSHRLDTSPPALSRAGWELPTAMREVTGGTAGPATFEDIDRRIEMSSMVRSLHRLNATLAGVASVFRETARSAPLLVDAQTANILLKSTDDRHALPHEQSVVAPRDMIHKRAIPIPDRLRAATEDAAAQVAAASRASLRATLSAGDGTRDTASIPPPAARETRDRHRLSTDHKHEALNAAGRSATGSDVSTHW
ncbi:hypothetical protein [Ornithinimicrobium sediminis]|uniref:hypothetical protein n=1 Tax=Ornithinimicrobium sediminis TaxID=2904603 RepID=UPI001E55AEE7|nr:hypothetical protein [Ornithinimicrobium sediminis]MCE0485428.1 hypothetical protein [Ornithinimicrobium sediminis]